MKNKRVFKNVGFRSSRIRLGMPFNRAIVWDAV